MEHVYTLVFKFDGPLKALQEYWGKKYFRLSSHQSLNSFYVAYVGDHSQR